MGIYNWHHWGILIVTLHSSPATPAYQWRKDGTAISGATLSSYSKASVQPADAGTYTVQVTAAGASALSLGAVLTVLVPCAGPPAGLVAWWPGEASASDVVGGNNGAFSGSYVAGKVGQAFSLDGSTAYIKVPAGSGLNVGAGAGMTMNLGFSRRIPPAGPCGSGAAAPAPARICGLIVRPPDRLP